MSAVSQPAFTIILCTRDRCGLLKRALASLDGLEYARDEVELLVVDNGSSDATPQVVETFKRSSNLPTRYHFESKVGLSAARNSGIKQARGRHLFFTDDDQLVHPAILSEYQRVIEETGARVLQGMIDLSFPEGRPDWLHGPLDGILGKTRALPEGEADIDLYGGNLVLRRDLFEALDAFREDLGKGASGYSEDTELTRRLRQAGIPIVFCPSALVYHVIESDRANPSFFVRNAFEKGVSDGLIAPASTHFAKLFAKTSWSLSKHAARLIFTLTSRDPHRKILTGVHAANEVGRVLGLAKQRTHSALG